MLVVTLNVPNGKIGLLSRRQIYGSGNAMRKLFNPSHEETT